MIEDVLVPVALFFSIVAIAKIIGDYRTRKKLIEKGVSAAEARAVLASARGAAHESSLKWGLVAAAVGLGLIVVQLASFESGPVVPGIVLLFAGGALVGHYFLRAGERWQEVAQAGPGDASQTPEHQTATRAGGADA